MPLTVSAVGLNASEQATTAAAANKLAIGFIDPPYEVLPCSAIRTRKAKRRAAKGPRRAPNDIIGALQDVLPKVLVLDDPQQPFPHRRPVEHDVLDGIVGQLEQHLLEQRREHGVQPPRADVFHLLVYLRRDARDFLDAVGGEFERRAVGLAQRGVLFGQRVLGLGHDPHEIRFRERRQLDADREAALQLRNQIARLGDVKRAGRDEQDVIGADVAIARLHGRAFDDRQQVALHALTGDVGTRTLATLAGDLVDLIDEDDAVVLDAVERLVHYVVHVHELLQLFVDQDPARLVQMHGPALFLFGYQLLNHFAEIDVRPFHPLRRLHHLEHGEVLLLDFDFDVALLELPVLQLRAQLLARAPAPFVGLRLGLGESRLDIPFGRDDEQWSARTRLRTSRTLRTSTRSWCGHLGQWRKQKI